MLGNIAGQLILGVVRWGVEKRWDIVTFGKLSLTLSISNMVLTFVTSLGIILFPILRRTDEKKLPEIFLMSRTILNPIMYLMLIFYLPLSFVIGKWLPNYSDSLYFMGILFPMFVYEGRMALLINTYLKSLRKETTILIVNITTLIMSVILTVLFVSIFHNLLLSVLLILLMLSFRCILAELLLSKYLNINILKDTIKETILTMIFVITNIYIEGILGLCIFVLGYTFYIVQSRNQIKNSINQLRKIAKN